MSTPTYLHCLLFLLLISRMETQQDMSPLSTFAPFPPEIPLERTSTDIPEKQTDLGRVLMIKCDEGICTMSKNSSLYNRWKVMKTIDGIHDTMSEFVKLKFPENLQEDEYILNEILGLAMNKFVPKQDLKKEYDSLVESKVQLLKKEGRYYRSPRIFQCDNSNYPQHVQDCTRSINDAYELCFNQYQIQDSKKEFCDITETLQKCQDIFDQKVQPHCLSDPMPLLETLLESLCKGRENEKCAPSLILLQKDFECIPEGLKQDFKNLGHLLPEKQKFKPEGFTLCQAVSDYVNNTLETNFCPFLDMMEECIKFYRDAHTECFYDTAKIERKYFKRCVAPQMRMEDPRRDSAAGRCRLSTILLGLLVVMFALKIRV